MVVALNLIVNETLEFESAFNGHILEQGILRRVEHHGQGHTRIYSERGDVS